MQNAAFLQSMPMPKTCLTGETSLLEAAQTRQRKRALCCRQYYFRLKAVMFVLHYSDKTHAEIAEAAR